MTEPQGPLFANRYQATGLLGEGGMGQVHRVLDTFDGDKPLALKLIKLAADAATDDQKLRFKAEFRAMARLQHPNTLAVHGYGELPDGNLYIAMELVPGQELSDVIGGKQMPFAQAYPLLIQLLQALDFVHSRQYVHRDIKAQNIRVTPEGRLKLMDFGLMGQVGQPSSMQVTGTPGYLAPEVAQGGVIGAYSDLYSVGCLAYEMVTGKLPFEGRLIDVVRAHVQTAPIPLRQRRADAPAALEKVVMKLLEKDPMRRYRDAGQVVEDLAAIAGIAVARESLDQQASYLATGEIVGREAELAQLDAALAATRAGDGRAIWVAAPAGTGKSRVVQELELRARLAGAVVMHGACHDEGMAPYEALTRALRDSLALGNGADAEKYMGALARLFPEMCDDPAAAPAIDAEGLAEATVGWVGQLASKAPVLWLMDDLHWADAQTVEILNQAVCALRGKPVLIIGTFRDDETPAGSPVWRAIDEGDAEALRLQPLNREGQDALLAAMLPGASAPEAFLSGLHDATGGNPFYLTEVLRSLMEDGHLARRGGAWRFPEDPNVLRPLSSMEATIRRRLEHLPRGPRRTLAVAAVLGHDWDLASLREASGMGDDDLLADLDELVARQFLALTSCGAYRFPHDRVREVTYWELAPQQRRTLHQRAGEVLEAKWGELAAAHAHDLAPHFLEGGDGPRAHRYLMLAAEQADEAGADLIAVNHWRAAEAVLVREGVADADPRMLQVRFLVGWNGFVNFPEVAHEILAKLLATYEVDPAGVDALLAPLGIAAIEIYGVAAIAAGFCGYPDRSEELVARAAAMLPAGQEGIDAELLTGMVAFIRTGGLMAAGRLDECLAGSQAAAAVLTRELPPDAPRSVRGTRVGAVAVQNCVALQGIRPDPALRDWAGELAKANHDEEPFTAWFYFGLWPAWTGRHDEAQAYIEKTVQKSRKVGGPPYPWVLYLRPYMLWQRGEHETALAMLDKSLIAFPHFRHHALAFTHALALRGHLLVDLGRLDEGASVFDDLVALSDERGLGLGSLLGRLGQAIVALRRGLPSEAKAAALAVHERSVAGPLRNPLMQARAARALGNAAMALGDWEGAIARFEESLGITTRPEQDNLAIQAMLHRDLGRLWKRRGDREQASAAYKRAGEIYHGLRNTHGLHQVTLDLEALHGASTVVPQTQASPEARWQLMRGMV